MYLYRVNYSVFHEAHPYEADPKTAIIYAHDIGSAYRQANSALKNGNQEGEWTQITGVYRIDNKEEGQR